MSKDKLNILIQLAVIDRNLAGPEMKWMYTIAKAHGVNEDDIKEMLRQPKPIGDLNTLTDDERFEYLYLVIQMMKIDGQVFKSEISFCEDIAEKLGYQKKVVGEISKNIYSDPSITADRDLLRERAARYRG